MMDCVDLHKLSSNPKNKLLKTGKCGCYYCLEIFNTAEIENFHGTHVCPYCGIDSIIVEYSGYLITKEYLVKMNESWFK